MNTVILAKFEVQATSNTEAFTVIVTENAIFGEFAVYIDGGVLADGEDQYRTARLDKALARAAEEVRLLLWSAAVSYAQYEFGPCSMLRIHFDYKKGDPGCHTRRNGDPGWPPTPESVTITACEVWTRPYPQADWTNTGIVLPEEVTNNAFLEERCWEMIEHTRDIAREERDYE